MKNDIDFTTEYDEEDEQENDDFDADIHFPWPYYTHTNHRSYKAKKDYTCYVTAGFATAFLICLSFIMLSKGALEQFPLTSYLVVIGQMLGFIALLPLSYKKFMARIKRRNIDLSDIAATEYDSGKNNAVSALHWIKGVYFGVVPMTFGTATIPFAIMKYLADHDEFFTYDSQAALIELERQIIPNLPTFNETILCNNGYVLMEIGFPFVIFPYTYPDIFSLLNELNIVCRPFVPEINFKTQKTERLQTLRLIVFYSYQAPDDTIIRAILLFSSDFCFLKFSPLNRIGAHRSNIRS